MKISAKLKEVASIQAGQSAPQDHSIFGNEGFSFIRAGDLLRLIKGEKQDRLPKILPDIATKCRLKLFPRNSVIFAKSGMSCTKGYVYKLTDDSYLVSHLACITPQENINPDYLSYYLRFHQPKKLIKDSSYPSISLSDIGNMNISFPNIKIQNQIVEQMSLIDLIISKNKELILLLDEIVKSRFIEMFGVPGTDPYNYGLHKLSDVVVVNPKKQNDPRLKNLEQKVSFVPMNAVSESGDINVTTPKKIKEVQKGFTYFQENDVLFAKITPCMENGKGAVAKKLINGIGFGSTEFHVLRPGAKINPEWLYAITTFREFREDAEKHMTGSAGQKRVPANYLENFTIAVPPISEQNKFSQFKTETGKSKLAIQQSINELEILKKKLMQEYFG